MKKAFSFLVLLLCIIACDDKEPVESMIQLAKDQPTEFEVDGKENSINISFTTGTTWFLKKNNDKDEWYTFAPAQGQQGQTTVTINIQQNDTKTNRKAEFTLFCGKESQAFSIKQAFLETEEENPGEEGPTTEYIEIPDPAFMAYLTAKHDADADNRISKEEALAITQIDCPDLEIKSIKGVEAMKNLEILSCHHNMIEDDIILDSLPKLRKVECDHNLYKKISAVGCEMLEELQANDNFYYADNGYDIIFTLSEIDLRGCKALRTLDLTDNNLTRLDVNECPELTNLNCRYNKITDLRFENCTKLQRVSCRTNQLHGQVLDFSMCPDLNYLECYETGITGLNLKGCTQLTEIYAQNNSQLSSIDVSSCTELTLLDLLGCKVANIDLSNNPKLKKLDISLNNSLEKIDLSANVALEDVRLGFNKLPALDVSMCPKLQNLSAENNQIATVNFDGCTSLTSLLMSENKLTDIDLGTCSALEMLTLNYNQLTTLNVNNSPNLIILNCSFNKLTEIACNKCTQITALDLENNELTTLDLRENKSLIEVYAKMNNLIDFKINGLKELSICEVYNNKLPHIDLRGCIALSELYIHKNELTYLSVHECLALKQLDCRSNLIKGLDLSNNPTMTFLFATENPNLKTVFVAKGAAYSSLMVDEGVNVFEKEKDDFNDVDSDNWGDADIDPWK